MEEFFERLNAYHRKYMKYVKLLLLIVAALLVIRFLPKLVILFLPFLLAMLISKLVDPLVRLLEKIHLPRALCSAIAVVLGTSAVGGAIYWIVSNVIKELVSFAKTFPALYDSSRIYISGLVENAQDMFDLMPQEITDFINTMALKLGDSITSWLSSLLQPITSGAFTFAKNVPSILVFIIVTLLATYFMSSDKEKILSYLHKVLPNGSGKLFKILKNEMFFALLAWCKAQLKLMAITSVELFIGFTILGEEYAILLALCIAVIDALPILGTGTVLIPWAVISFIFKDFRMGIGLAIIYGVCLLVRQLLEPKIVGNQIGLYPLVTLAAMYVGLRLYGFVGMVLLPLCVLILRNLYCAGAFDWFFPNREKTPIPSAKVVPKGKIPIVRNKKER